MDSKTASEKFKANLIRIIKRVEFMISDASDKGYTVTNPRLVGLVKEFITAMESETLIMKFIKFSMYNLDDDGKIVLDEEDEPVVNPDILNKIKDRNDILIKDDLVGLLRDTPLKGTNIFKQIYVSRIDEDPESDDGKLFRKDINYLWEGLSALVDKCFEYDENLKLKNIWEE